VRELIEPTGLNQKDCHDAPCKWSMGYVKDVQKEKNVKVLSFILFK